MHLGPGFIFNYLALRYANVACFNLAHIKGVGKTHISFNSYALTIQFELIPDGKCPLMPKLSMYYIFQASSKRLPLTDHCSLALLEENILFRP